MNDYNFTCDICGRYCGAGDDAPSIVTMTANYGSIRHNGDKLTLKVCGNCIDWFMDGIPMETGKWEQRGLAR